MSTCIYLFNNSCCGCCSDLGGISFASGLLGQSCESASAMGAVTVPYYGAGKKLVTIT